MSTAFDSLSSIAASASGLEDNTSPPSVDESNVSRPTPPSKVSDVPQPEEENSSEKGDKETWWEWLTHKADEVEGWVEEFVHEHVPGGGQQNEDGSEESKDS